MSRTRRMQDPLRSTAHWWHRFKVSTQKFAIFLTLMAVGLGFTYVWLTNRTATHGFAIEKLQSQIAELRTSNEKLELQAADLRALSTVALSSETEGLQPTDTFEVLSTGTGAVALQP